jgi:hypothetical protein
MIGRDNNKFDALPIQRVIQLYHSNKQNRTC